MKIGLAQLGICGMMVAGAGADILHDTTGFDLDQNWLVGLDSGIDVINQPADSILIAGGDFILESITVRLNVSQLIGAVGGDYEIRFWGDNVDRPGALLESFTVSDSNLLDNEDVTMFSAGGLLLEDGGTYWVSVALPDNMSIGTWASVDAQSLGRAVSFSGDEDEGWVPTGSNSAMYLQVTGTAVPVPGTLALLGVGGLMARRRR